MLSTCFGQVVVIGSTIELWVISWIIYWN